MDGQCLPTSANSTDEERWALKEAEELRNLIAGQQHIYTFCVAYSDSSCVSRVEIPLDSASTSMRYRKEKG